MAHPSTARRCAFSGCPGARQTNGGPRPKADFAKFRQELAHGVRHLRGSPISKSWITASPMEARTLAASRTGPALRRLAVSGPFPGTCCCGSDASAPAFSVQAPLRAWSAAPSSRRRLRSASGPRGVRRRGPCRSSRGRSGPRTSPCGDTARSRLRAPPAGSLQAAERCPGRCRNHKGFGTSGIPASPPPAADEGQAYRPGPPGEPGLACPGWPGRCSAGRRHRWRL